MDFNSGYLCRFFRISFLFVVFIVISCFDVSAQHGHSAAWDTAKMKSGFNIAGASLQFKTVTADSLSRILFEKAKEAGNIEYMGKAAALVAISEIKLRKPSPLSWYDTAMQYLKESGDKKMIAFTNLQAGYSFGEKFQFKLGAQFLLKAADNYETLRDSGMLITTYTAIGNMYQGFGDLKNEMKYAKMAVALVEKTGDKNPDRRWGAYAVLAISYEDAGEYDKALATHEKNIANATNDWVLFLSYTNTGVTLRKQGAYTRAEGYFKDALAYAKKISDDYSYAAVYDNLARTSLYTNDFVKAKQYLGLALRYADKSKNVQKQLDVYETAWLIGKATGDNRTALDFFAKRSAIKDSLLTAERSRTVYDLQIRYETEKKEIENQRLQYANALKTAEKEKAESDKRKLVVGAAITLVLLSGFFILLYRNRIIRNKLQEEQVFTEAIMEGEQNERIRIARDLHDSIGQMLSVAKMNVSTLHYQLPDNRIAGASVELLDNALVELRSISHNLMPEDLDFGLFGAIENICDKINQSGKIKLALQVPGEIRQHRFDKSVMLTIYRIIQEVLNNMIKHAEADEISIIFTNPVEGNISIFVKDNGKGFNTEELNRSRGLGWKNISVRVRMLNGRMQVRSEYKKGTQVDIIIPVA